jgi:hypothetical protein
MLGFFPRSWRFAPFSVVAAGKPVAKKKFGRSRLHERSVQRIGFEGWLEVSCGFSQIDSQIFEGNSHGLQTAPGFGSDDRFVAALSNERATSRGRLLASAILRTLATKSDFDLLLP